MIIRRLAAASATLGVALLGAKDLRAQEPVREHASGPDVAAPDATLEGASAYLLVEGMRCPLCAGHLEERLREIPAVDAVHVRVSDGLVQVRPAQGLTLDDDALAGAVASAGLQLRDIRSAGR